jgi:hypothetical protein
MRRSFALVVSLAFTLALALHAQLSTNLDCKCTRAGDGEYLCKCVAAKGDSETPAKSTATPHHYNPDNPQCGKEHGNPRHDDRYEGHGNAYRHDDRKRATDLHWTQRRAVPLQRQRKESVHEAEMIPANRTCGHNRGLYDTFAF